MNIDPFTSRQDSSESRYEFEPMKPRTGIAMTRYPSRSGRYLLIVALALLAAGMVAWTFRSPSAATGYKKIVNADIHQLCMDVKADDNYNAPGARAQQWNCTGVQEQQFLRTFG